jgi:hypothetical protein
LGITSEPVYASPAAWYLGDLKEDEVVTLTYLAKVTEEVEPGIYKDLAWTQGEDLLGGGVLGYAETEGKINDIFVGTQVEVVVEDDIETEVDVDEEEGEVLGISILPATGASTFWVNLVLVLASIGGLLLLIGGIGTMKKDKDKAMKKGKLLAGILGMVFAFLIGSKVYAVSTTVVRLSEPDSSVNDEFDLVFVAMNADGDELKARCYYKYESGSYASFGSEKTIPSSDGGDSKVCAVTDSILDDDGEYSFEVRVTPDDWSNTYYSNEVTVEYDGDGPDKPEYIRKEKVNDCVNKITLKTDDDGETSSVRVYADDDKEIDIDDSHKIETESIGPDEKFSFEHIVSGDDCDKTWYYAVVAFDDAGNASKPRAETITTTTTTTEEEEETTEAILIEGGAGIGGEGAAGVGGEGTEGTEGTEGEEGMEVDMDGDEEGEVLGETTVGEEIRGLLKSPWFWIVIAVLGIVIIRSAVKKSKKQA